MFNLLLSVSTRRTKLGEVSYGFGARAKNCSSNYSNVTPKISSTSFTNFPQLLNYFRPIYAHPLAPSMYGPRLWMWSSLNWNW